MQDAVREVRVATETGKVLRILSNDLDATAQEIADLYKRRWAIELFFRWIKQTLKIARFLGTSENAIRIQIAVALIKLSCCCASRKPRKKPFKARSPSSGSSAPTSCIDAASTACSKPSRPSSSTLIKCNSNGADTGTGQPWDKPGDDDFRLFHKDKDSSFSACLTCRESAASLFR